jgi:hypothetical protein
MHDQLVDAAARVVEPKRRKVRKLAVALGNSVVELVAGRYVKAVDRIWGAKVGVLAQASRDSTHFSPRNPCVACGCLWRALSFATRLCVVRSAGLDLARRRNHSALVLLEVGLARLSVIGALRLPQAPLRQQFALITLHLAGLDLVVFDESGLGDAAELLPREPLHVDVCLIGGDRSLTRSATGGRLIVGKQWLIQRLGAAMRGGSLTVAEQTPGRRRISQASAGRVEGLRVHARVYGVPGGNGRPSAGREAPGQERTKRK